MCTSQQEVKVWYSVAFHENSTQLAIRSVDKYIMCPHPKLLWGQARTSHYC